MNATAKSTESFFELFKEAGFPDEFADRDHALLFLMQAEEAVHQFCSGGFTTPALANMGTLMGNPV